MPCDKKCFTSEKEASRFAKRVHSKGRRQRAYFCDHCKKWHLTTQHIDEYRPRKKEKYERSKIRIEEYL